ncbi:hypothetical protein [Flammeovirga kamogawensis]|uniref:Uncharacterized protein n=1 Tax=Flammeovirga kamogawensis TaxID=373891 RepID=A0ABX8H2K5_9BACT|nr:hypothetical protein [Flammeovirga kamogawensis]MBB6462219.1 hypothetical protein [Flammeovirga kamogawensis]QWG09380.1 hypothetical protein KM029_22500 [Flammeovirga kamogawensis]TRX64898.1 hypothetical protein EO216_20410 [Flammeovirga kamogawensis]
MNTIAQVPQQQKDNSRKTVLARGCDPVVSLEFSKIVPPLIGNAIYVPTTNDVEFIEKLKSQKWSVVYFAPGACRFSAVKKPIPGGNIDTRGWTLEQYKALVKEYQGEEIEIAESPFESESIQALNKALENAREIK